MASPRRLVCPWCGHAGELGDACAACGGGFDAESRRVAQNDMGPWFVRDPRRPFQPGCSYEALARRIDRGEIVPTTILRGPTTRQLWAAARRVAAVSHLLGYCHACDAKVPRGAERCGRCGSRFGPWLDRNRLGVAPVRMTPDEAPEDEDSGGPAGSAVLQALSGGSTASSLVRYDAADESRRLGELAERLAARDLEDRRGSGSGTWTVAIAGLLVVLAALVMLPMMPSVLASLREASSGPGRGGDLPGGAFRSSVADDQAGERRSGVQPDAVGTDDAALESEREREPEPEPDRARTARRGAEPAAPAASVTASIRREREDDDEDERPAAAGSGSNAAALADMRRWRRLADDPAVAPAERLRAWRLIQHAVTDARREGRAMPRAFDESVVAGGIDRVHLDAFLRGDSPSDLMAADPGPPPDADGREDGSDASAAGAGDPRRRR